MTYVCFRNASSWRFCGSTVIIAPPRRVTHRRNTQHDTGDQSNKSFNHVCNLFFLHVNIKKSQMPPPRLKIIAYDVRKDATVIELNKELIKNTKTLLDKLHHPSNVSSPHTKRIKLHGDASNTQSHSDALTRGLTEVRGYDVVMQNYESLSEVVVPVIAVRFEGEFGKENYALIFEQPQYPMDVEDLLYPWLQESAITYRIHPTVGAIDHRYECKEVVPNATTLLDKPIAELVRVEYTKGGPGVQTIPQEGCKLYRPNTTCIALYEYVTTHLDAHASDDDENVRICAVHRSHNTQIVRHNGSYFYVRQANIIRPENAEQLAVSMKRALQTFHDVTGCAFGDVAERNMVVDASLTNVRLIDFGNVTNSDSQKRADNERLRDILAVVEKYITPVST